MSNSNTYSKTSSSSLAQIEPPRKPDDSSSTLCVEWSNKYDATSPKQEQAPRREYANRKSSMDTAVSEISALSFGSAKGGGAMKAAKKPAPSSGAPTSTIISMVASLGLEEEKEHTEQQSTSSNRSLGSLGFLRRNVSTGEISAASSAKTSRRGSITSRRGKRMSELTNNSNWDDDDDGGDDDDDDKSIDLEDMTRPDDASGSSRSIFTYGGTSNASGGSSRSVFSNFVDRVKHTSSSNLSAFSDGLAEEAGLKKHRSAYFKQRVSVRVRRASDFLFSSHHKPTIDDVSEEGRLDDVSEEGSHDDVLDGL